MTSRARWLVVWILALLPLLGWWMYGLFDVDEGFYGAVVAEMNRKGEWITPLYNGHPWFEKPILLYWLAKPSLQLFGENVGPRLPSILTALATYAVMAWFARRRLDDRTAQLSVLILSGSLLMVGTARMMMTDMPLLACLTAALLLFWESLVGKPAWRIGTAALLGLGVLAKGPVAVILFGLVAGWTYWREPTLRPAFKGHWPVGFAVFSVIVASWYVPAYIQNGHIFVQKFLIEQNIGRFTGGDAAHTLPGIGGLLTGIGMYIAVILLGMLPWSLFLIKAWPRRTATEDGNAALERYLAVWAGVVFVFFTISGAKLVHYLLPMFPALALLIAAYASANSKNLNRWFAAAGAWCAFMSILANGVFLWWYRASGQQEVHGIARYVRQEGGAVALYQMGRRNKDMGTGKPKLQETSLPSLLMVLNRDALDTDQFSEILASPTPIWVITRENRIRPENFVQAQVAGRRLMEIKPPVHQDAFKLYLLR